MRILLALVLVASMSRVSSAQSETGTIPSLRSVVQAGQMVVVTEDSGRETTGVVRDVTDSTLTLDGHVFPSDAVYALRRTDPLGNGTLAGVGVALGAAVALAVRCGRYQYSEESGPCTAAAVSSALITVPLAAFIGRQIDRSVGNQELYRRRRQSFTSVSPLWGSTGLGVQASVTLRWTP